MVGCVVKSGQQTLTFADDEGRFSLTKTDSIKELAFLFVGMNSFKIDVNQITEDTDLGTLYMFQSPRYYSLKKGTATERYPNGQLLFSFSVRKSFAHGPYTEYYENGNLKIQGQYNRHAPIGVWTYLTRNGDVSKIEFGDDGLYKKVN